LDTNKTSLDKEQKYKSPILISNGDRRGTKRWRALTKNSNTRPQSSLNPKQSLVIPSSSKSAWNKRNRRKHQNVILVDYNGAVLYHSENGRYLSRQEVYGVVPNYASSATFWQDILSPFQIRKYFIHKLYTTNEVRFSTWLSHSCDHTRLIHNSIPVRSFDHHVVEICALRGSYTQSMKSAACFIRWKIRRIKSVMYKWHT